MPSIIRAPFYVPRQDDSPIWTGAPINSGAIEVTNTQLKQFGRPGQVKAKNWAPGYTYDDHASWSGAPLNSDLISLLTFQKLYGAGGQTPTKAWSPYVWDDPAVWSGAPLGSDTLSLLTFRKFFGAGGQSPTKSWSVSYTLDDPAYWSGSPQGSAAIPLLTQQKEFGAGGQPPTKNWSSYVWDDPAFWQGTPVRSDTVPLLTQQRVYAAGGQVPTKQWRYDFDDAAIWSGSPISYNLINELTAQRFYGVGGQVPTKDWVPYVYDEASSWQFLFPKNQSTTAAPPSPAVPRFWRFNNDDPSVWSGSPISYGAINLLSSQKIFAAGGQVPTKNWAAYWLDDASVWAAAPLPTNSIRATLSQVKEYGQAGQATAKDWTPYLYDEASWWQWVAPRWPNVSSVAAPLRPSFVQYGDDASVWSAKPLSSASIVVTTTQQKIYGQPGQAPTRAWHYDYDDAAPWQIKANAPLSVPASPFRPAWPATGFDDATVWQFIYKKPIAPTSLTVRATYFAVYDEAQVWQFKYAAPLSVPPSPVRPNWWLTGWDDAGVWNISSKGLNIRFLVQPKVRRKLDFGMIGEEFYSYPYQEIVQNNLPNLSKLPFIAKEWNLNIPQDTPSVMTGHGSAQFYIPLLLLKRIINADPEVRTEPAPPQVEVASCPAENRSTNADTEDHSADATAESRTGEIPPGDI